MVYKQPNTPEERAAIARTCELRLNLPIPTLLDEMSNKVDRAYAALPERLYLIDAEGRIAYRSRPGPWGFDTGEFERAIESHLADQIGDIGQPKGLTT